MLHTTPQVLKKRERDTATDSEQSYFLRKAAKLGENADAASVISRKSTPKFHRPFRPDSATTPANPSTEALIDWQQVHSGNDEPRLAHWKDLAPYKMARRNETTPPLPPFLPIVNTQGLIKGMIKAKGTAEASGQRGYPHDDERLSIRGDQHGRELTQHDNQYDNQYDGQQAEQQAVQQQVRIEEREIEQREEGTQSLWSTTSSDEPPIQEFVGDLFDAPDDVVLVHACNTQGSWGAGIAKEFRTRYPKAFSLYQEHCLVTHNPKTKPVLTGTCLLIPPAEEHAGAKRHWIACLFTSEKYGRNKDSKGQILASTSPAFRHLLALLRRQAREGIGPSPQEIRMCQINSGLFAVKWQDTKIALEAVLGTVARYPPIRVYSQPPAPSMLDTVRERQTTLKGFVHRY